MTRKAISDTLSECCWKNWNDGEASRNIRRWLGNRFSENIQQDSFRYCPRWWSCFFTRDLFHSFVINLWRSNWFRGQRNLSMAIKSNSRPEQVDHPLLDFSSWYVMRFDFSQIFSSTARAIFVQMTHLWIFAYRNRVTLLTENIDDDSIKMYFYRRDISRLLVRPLTIKTPKLVNPKMFLWASPSRCVSYQENLEFTSRTSRVENHNFPQL